MNSVYLRIHVLSFLSLFSTLAYLPEWKMSRCFTANHRKPVRDDFWGWKRGWSKVRKEDCRTVAETGGHTWSGRALCWTLVWHSWPSLSFSSSLCLPILPRGFHCCWELQRVAHSTHAATGFLDLIHPFKTVTQPFVHCKETVWHVTQPVVVL